MSRRLPIASGLVFAAIATIYGLVSRDAGGATLLGFLAVGMSVMWYVLLSGSTRDS